jgi:hypothetical protein
MIAAWSYKIQWPLLFMKPFRAPLKDSKRKTNLDTIHPLRLGLFIDCACNFPTDSNQDIDLIEVNGGIQLQRNLKRNAVHKGITQGERETAESGTWTPRSPSPRMRSPSVTTMTSTFFSGQFFNISSALPL